MSVEEVSVLIDADGVVVITRFGGSAVVVDMIFTASVDWLSSVVVSTETELAVVITSASASSKSGMI
jgi:hypothetical protein